MLSLPPPSSSDVGEGHRLLAGRRGGVGSGRLQGRSPSQQLIGVGVVLPHFPQEVRVCQQGVELLGVELQPVSQDTEHSVATCRALLYSASAFSWLPILVWSNMP
eukprot:750722-Hanusia_phi.AAC.3